MSPVFKCYGMRTFSPLQASFKLKASKPPSTLKASSPLQAPWNAPSSPLEAPFKVKPPSSFFEAPWNPLEGIALQDAFDRNYMQHLTKSSKVICRPAILLFQCCTLHSPNSFQYACSTSQLRARGFFFCRCRTRLKLWRSSIRFVSIEYSHIWENKWDIPRCHQKNTKQDSKTQNNHSRTTKKAQRDT